MFSLGVMSVHLPVSTYGALPTSWQLATEDAVLLMGEVHLSLLQCGKVTWVQEDWVLEVSPSKRLG